VTGPARYADVDGGTTTIRSPLFRLPAGTTSTLRLRYWVGMSAGAGSGDRFAVRLVDDRGTPVGAPLLAIAGTRTALRPAWRTLVVALPASTAGMRVAVELAAREDAIGGEATMEAGVDSVRVTAP